MRYFLYTNADGKDFILRSDQFNPLYCTKNFEYKHKNNEVWVIAQGPISTLQNFKVIKELTEEEVFLLLL